MQKTICRSSLLHHSCVSARIRTNWQHHDQGHGEPEAGGGFLAVGHSHSSPVVLGIFPGTNCPDHCAQSPGCGDLPVPDELAATLYQRNESQQDQPTTDRRNRGKLDRTKPFEVAHSGHSIRGEAGEGMAGSVLIGFWRGVWIRGGRVGWDLFAHRPAVD